MPAGRPPIYSEELADAICERLSDGRSLRSICLDEDMPGQTTVFKWLASNEEFAKKYARAREAQADAIFDEMLDIADDGTNDYMGDDEKYNGDAVARSKLRVDTRKWMASKLAPKKYGDKQLIGSDPDNPLPTGLRISFVKPGQNETGVAE